MALHEIHWDPTTRGLRLVANHEMGPDSPCGWVGEEVDDVEALTAVFLADGGSLGDHADIYEVVGVDGPTEIAGEWFDVDDNGTLFRVTSSWCSLGELAERGTVEDHLLDAEWVGHKGTIPVCEVVMTSFDGGPSIDTIGPIACPSCGVTCADHQPREVS
jgi:hypothetical protein